MGFLDSIPWDTIGNWTIAISGVGVLVAVVKLYLDVRAERRDAARRRLEQEEEERRRWERYHQRIGQLTSELDAADKVRRAADSVNDATYKVSQATYRMLQSQGFKDPDSADTR